MVVLSSAYNDILTWNLFSGVYIPVIKLSFCIARANGSKQRIYKSGERLQPCRTDLVRLNEFDIQWLTIIEDETSFYKTNIQLIK